jgi:nucleotide-binding universal stress UspA family protein
MSQRRQWLKRNNETITLRMTLRGPVLAGTDLSPASDEALRQAARLAAELSSKLFVCHVVPELIPDGSVFGEFRRANLKAGDSLLAQARAAVDQQVNTVLGSDTSAVDVILESGTPHAGLLRQADATGAGVVVTAPGPVALDVARHAVAAVLIARRSPHGPVVAASDFSETSLPAVRAAAAAARRRESPLHLLHASDVGLFALGHASAAAMPYLLSSPPIALEGLDNLHAVAKHRLEETVAEMNLSATTAVIAGPAADVIVEYAESIHAELVVVGTHGRSGLARLTLGSTAASVIESAPCSVLIVRVSVR